MKQHDYQKINRMKNLHLVIVALTGFLFAACTTTRSSAPVVERTGSVKSAERAKAPASASSRDDVDGYYTVKRGDTLYRIALEHGQNYRDIVAWNNLSDPNDIKINQVLRVAPLEAAPVDLAPAIAKAGVEVKPLAMPSVSSATLVTPPLNKVGPRGDKRPYSAANMEAMQKPDLGPGGPPVSTTVANTEPDSQAGTAVGRPPILQTPSNEGENFAWIWPAEGRILASFDDNKKGIDIAGKAGQQVVAAGPGKVMYAGSGIRGYGNLVIIKHTNTLLSAYAHNKAILVKEGETVARGQKIAEMGNSDSDATKLHFEIRHQGKPVDPSKFLPGR